MVNDVAVSIAGEYVEIVKEDQIFYFCGILCYRIFFKLETKQKL